ncbi:redox-sensing transcriptional repressor Rex [bacterium]|nr:redox-sensing transcriptional repressor Rex [bacterium]
MMICTNKNCFSTETIRRLSVYLQNLRRIRETGTHTISSREIGAILNVTPAQFRKDLSYFGEFGRRGVGYETDQLISVLEHILGVNKAYYIGIVGAGRLGRALINYHGFAGSNIRVRAAFDVDPEKIGTVVHGITVYAMDDFFATVREHGIDICVLSVPVEGAQQATNSIVAAGVKAILNFSPVILQVPDTVYIQNIDMLSELERLIFYLNNDTSR